MAKDLMVSLVKEADDKRWLWFSIRVKVDGALGWSSGWGCKHEGEYTENIWYNLHLTVKHSRDEDVLFYDAEEKNDHLEENEEWYEICCGGIPASLLRNTGQVPW